MKWAWKGARRRCSPRRPPRDGHERERPLLRRKRRKTASRRRADEALATAVWNQAASLARLEEEATRAA